MKNTEIWICEGCTDNEDEKCELKIKVEYENEFIPGFCPLNENDSTEWSRKE